MGTYILVFGDDFSHDEVITGEAETLEKATKQARFWVDRRHEKSGRACTAGYYAEHTIDVEKMVQDRVQDGLDHYRRQSEERDRREYKRLQDKYSNENEKGPGGVSGD